MTAAVLSELESIRPGGWVRTSPARSVYQVADPQYPNLPWLAVVEPGRVNVFSVGRRVGRRVWTAGQLRRLLAGVA